jgi:HEPN domain-containing protein
MGRTEPTQGDSANQAGFEAWLRQALWDLEAADLMAAGGRYEWACFCCHQAAEKALKAVLAARNDLALVEHHSLSDLARKVRRFVPALRQLREGIRALEWHYLKARYPQEHFSWKAPGHL